MNADAVVFTAPNKVEFRRVTCPDPTPDDVVIRTTYSWISNGTEGSYLRGDRIGGDVPYLSGDPTPFPILPGYQKVGVVESVGEKVTDLKPGDTVFCTVGKVDGMFFPMGGHISPSISNRDWVWKLPRQPQPLAYSGMLLTQVGYNCGTRAPINPGQYAVVVGDGLVGQWAAQTLTAQGAIVIMVGMDAHRLSLASRLTNCYNVDIAANDWVKAVQGITKGNSAVSVDTVGSPQVTEKLIAVMENRGHIVSAGFCGTNDKVSLQALRDKELSLDSMSGHTRPRMDKTLELIKNGKLQTLPLITHHFPAAQAAQAWQVINSRSEPVLGVILDW
ncbi:MAG: zinc-binding dehydrogenase [Sedimentisphaerales bacterium]